MFVNEIFELISLLGRSLATASRWANQPKSRAGHEVKQQSEPTCPPVELANSSIQISALFPRTSPFH